YWRWGVFLSEALIFLIQCLRRFSFWIGWVLWIGVGIGFGFGVLIAIAIVVVDFSWQVCIFHLVYLYLLGNSNYLTLNFKNHDEKNHNHYDHCADISRRGGVTSAQTFMPAGIPEKILPYSVDS